MVCFRGRVALIIEDRGSIRRRPSLARFSPATCLGQKRTTDATANCVIEIDGDRIVVTYMRDEKDMDSAVYIQRSLSPDEQSFLNRIVAAAETTNQTVQRGGWPPG
jgi:hypothetical protein